MSISYDCWSMILPYIPNHSQCALTCKMFHEILCESTRASFLFKMPLPKNGGILIAASVDGTLRAWTGNTLNSPVLVVEENSRLIQQIALHAIPAVSFTLDNQYMALNCGGFTSVQQLSSPAANRLINVQPGQVQTIAITPDGQHIALGSTEIYKTEPGNLVKRIDRRASPFDPIAFSPDGKRLISSSTYAKIIKIWAWEKSYDRPLYTLQIQVPPKELAMSSNNRLLATASRAQIAVWDIKKAQIRMTLHCPEGPYTPCIWFNKEGTEFTITTQESITTWKLPPSQTHKRSRN